MTVADMPVEELKGFIPSLFNRDHGCMVSDMRLTTAELREVATRLGRVTNHANIVVTVERICHGEALEPWTYVSVGGQYDTTQTSKGYVVTGFQAMRVLGSFTGEPGRVMLKKWAEWSAWQEQVISEQRAAQAALAAKLAQTRAAARVALAFQRDYGWMENLVENLKSLQKVYDIAEDVRGYNLTVPATHRTTRAAIDKELRTYVGLLLAQVPEAGLDTAVRASADRVTAAAGEGTP